MKHDHLAAPSLAVLGAVISILRRSARPHSFTSALCETGRVYGLTHAEMCLYHSQFTTFLADPKTPPSPHSTWNYEYLIERFEAFRQACINAAKEVAMPKHDHTKGPDLAVIDLAIKLIEGSETHTCIALSAAVLKLHGMATDDRGCTVDTVLYRPQFRRFCLENKAALRSADWWDLSATPERQALRIAALRAFKQACIDAAGRGA